MKTLFILRAYSGILKSIEDNNWETSGIISMSKLIKNFLKTKLINFYLKFHMMVLKGIFTLKKICKKIKYLFLFV